MRSFVALLLMFVSAPVIAGATPWIPFEIENGHIYLPITLNGEPARALLDSGSEGNAISMAFLESHEGNYSRGQAIIVRGVNSEVTTHYVNDVQFGMHGAEFEVDDLMPFDDASFDFIIGLPFFNQFVVQIDYLEKQLRLVTHDAIDMKKFANVKMKRAANSVQPMVRVDLNGEDKIWLIFDTGSNGGVFIQRMRAEEHDWLERYATETSSVTGFTGESAGVDVFKIPTLTIGPFTLENVLVKVPEKGGKINLGQWRPGEWTTGTKIKRTQNADGILGYDVLRHFIVTVDFKRRRLNLDVPR